MRLLVRFVLTIYPSKKVNGGPQKEISVVIEMGKVKTSRTKRSPAGKYTITSFGRQTSGKGRSPKYMTTWVILPESQRWLANLSSDKDLP
jgi:hypothetical protein